MRWWGWLWTPVHQHPRWGICGGRRGDGSPCPYAVTQGCICLKCGFYAPEDWQGPPQEQIDELWHPKPNKKALTALRGAPSGPKPEGSSESILP